MNLLSQRQHTIRRGFIPWLTGGVQLVRYQVATWLDSAESCTDTGLAAPVNSRWGKAQC